MALDEPHARRLSTVAVLIEDALRRIEAVLRSIDDAGAESHRAFTQEQIGLAREKMAMTHGRLQAALQSFHVTIHRPEPQQVLAAEFATLWVILENARPERLKGYGREFTPKDKIEWTALVDSLMGDLDQIRNILLDNRRPSECAPE